MMAFCEPVVSKESQHLQLVPQNFVQGAGPFMVPDRNEHPQRFSDHYQQAFRLSFH